MNKEQATKFKNQIQFFIENPDKGLWFKGSKDEEWRLTKNPIFYYTQQYVENDEYAEFRKALADGKTVQYIFRKGTSDEHYRNVESKELNLHPSYYRIKPDKPKFTVGDWVQNTDVRYRPFKATQQWINNTLDQQHLFKLWEPKENEFVVTWMSGDCETYKVERFNINIRCDNIAPLEALADLNKDL